MKIRKILFSFFSMLACISASQAGNTSSQPQMYVGVQAGYADTNFSKSTMIATPANGSVPITSASIGNHVFAGRAYGGYQFNDYLALEGGYLKPRNTRYTNINGGAVPNGFIKEYAVDLTGKVFLPMAAYIHLSPYVKAGVAYVKATSYGGITRNGASDFGYTFHPLLGAGIGYDIMQNVTMDVSWTTITKRNTSLPRIDMLFLGLTFHFTPNDLTTGGHNYGDVEGTDP